MRKLLFLIFIFIPGLSGCNAQPPKQKETPGHSRKQDPIENFWRWFQVNEKKLRDFEKDPDKILTQVLDSARRIQPGLAIEFEPPKHNIITVTVSADGNRNLFPIVKKIVEKAPAIEGWSFVAFRQRMPPDKVKGMVLKAQDHELNPGKMKFFPIVSGDSLDIIIYADNVTEENFNQVAYGGLLLLDNILGEYDCVTKVRYFDFQNMPAKPDELKDLKPLMELAEYVDNFHKAKHK